MKEADFERRNREQIESTIKESELPCPRLELRWLRKENGLQCDYNFVIPVSHLDIREPKSGQELRFCMGWTTCGTSSNHYPLEPTGLLHTPFRDGAHASWDSYRTGLPAYVVYPEVDRAQLIAPVIPTEYSPEEEKEISEEVCGSADWARLSSNQMLSEQRNQLWEQAKKVKMLRDKQVPGSWAWTYFDYLYTEINNQRDKIGGSPFIAFDSWLRNHFREYELPGTKNVCSVCGSSVPDDLTQACFHLFPTSDREFLEAYIKAKKGN